MESGITWTMSGKEFATLATISSEGKIAIDWYEVERMSRTQPVSDIPVWARIMIAVRDKTYIEIGGITR